MSKDTSTTDETFAEANLAELEDDLLKDNYVLRKRTCEEEHHPQTFTQGIRLRIVSEHSSLSINANTLNVNEEMEEEIHQPLRSQHQNIISTSKRDLQNLVRLHCLNMRQNEIRQNQARLLITVQRLKNPPK